MPNNLVPVPSGNGQSPSSPAELPALLPDLFDPCGLGPIPAVPLIPEAIRRRHHVFVETDTRFRQGARFLAHLWRVDRNLPIGAYTDGNGKTRKLGSRLSAKAGDLGANFVDPAILPIVNHALVYREIGAVYELDRLKTNLLASQTLCFNVFAPLKRDLALATRFVDALLPGTLANVTDLRFETSPGRGDPRFTADGTAFDLAILGRSPANERVYLAVEVKYSESGHEPVPRFSGSFGELAARSGVFVDPLDPALRKNPIQQSYRQLSLAQGILEQGLADRAMLLFIAPGLNHLAQGTARAVTRHLKDPLGGPIPFVSITLEQVCAALAMAGLPDHARALFRRYLDFHLIDGELQLDEPPPPAPTTAKPSARPEPSSHEPAQARPRLTSPRRRPPPRARGA